MKDKGFDTEFLLSFEKGGKSNGIDGKRANISHFVCTI